MGSKTFICLRKLTPAAALHRGWESCACHGYSMVDEFREQPVSARQEGWHAVNTMVLVRPQCSECPGVEHCARPSQANTVQEPSVLRLTISLWKF